MCSTCGSGKNKMIASYPKQGERKAEIRPFKIAGDEEFVYVPKKSNAVPVR